MNKPCPEEQKTLSQTETQQTQAMDSDKSQNMDSEESQKTLSQPKDQHKQTLNSNESEEAPSHPESLQMQTIYSNGLLAVFEPSETQAMDSDKSQNMDSEESQKTLSQPKDQHKQTLNSNESEEAPSHPESLQMQTMDSNGLLAVFEPCEIKELQTYGPFESDDLLGTEATCMDLLNNIDASINHYDESASHLNTLFNLPHFTNVPQKRVRKTNPHCRV